MLRAPRRRITQLFRRPATTRKELAEVKAELAEWRDLFADAGAITQPDAGPPPPELLLAASRPPRTPRAINVQLPNGRTITAVIGGAGDPAEWWAALHQIDASGLTGATAIRRVALADGLHAAAVAVNGTVTVFTARDLPAGPQCHAGRLAVRAATPHRTLPAAAPAASTTWLHRAASTARAHATTAGSTATTAIIAAVITFSAAPGIARAPQQPPRQATAAAATHQHRYRRRPPHYPKARIVRHAQVAA